MLGRIRFTLNGAPGVATLGDDRRWTCPGWATLADTLNTRYSPEGDGPADGIVGRSHIAAAARWLGSLGTVEVDYPTPAPEPPSPLADIGRRLNLDLPADPDDERIY